MDLQSNGHSLTMALDAHGVPVARLTHATGAAATVYLHGATVASWRPAGDEERLFLSRAALFGPGEAIRGGVPVIFPQFGSLGPLRQHGFARRLTWTWTGDAQTGAAATDGDLATAFRLTDSPETTAAWPHPFQAELSVRLGARTLAMTLTIANTGDHAFSFTAALHTYLAVSDLGRARVAGLAGLRYRDQAAGGVEGRQDVPAVDFPGEVDRLYFDAPPELRLVEPARTTVIRSAGFPDAVIWNAGPAKAAQLKDLAPGDYLHFVCVEAAAAGHPVELAPGKRWQAAQTLEA